MKKGIIFVMKICFLIFCIIFIKSLIDGAYTDGYLGGYNYCKDLEVEDWVGNYEQSVDWKCSDNSMAGFKTNDIPWKSFKKENCNITITGFD